jgi:hypothetical protein
MRLLPTSNPFVPKGRRGASVPQDLSDHNPVVSGGEEGDLVDQIDDVHRAAAVLARDPLHDVAAAIQALSYEQKLSLAAMLRTSVTRLDAWARLMIEARAVNSMKSTHAPRSLRPGA